MNYMCTAFNKKARKQMGLMGTVAETGLGLALAGVNDARQVRQQRRLTDEQIRGAKAMSDINYEQQMKLWEATNYSAQTEQMRKAGLNVGLMYKGAGAGGTTAANPGNVSAGSSPVGGGEVGMALQMGLAKALQEAQIENIKADTNKKNVEAQKTGGVDTQKAGAEIEAIKQSVQSDKAKQALTEYQTKLAEIEANTAGMTQTERVNAVRLANDKLKADIRTAEADAGVNEATINDRITQIQNATNEQLVRIEAGQAGIQATQASTEQTKQKTENLKQENITQELNNQLRKNGVEPSDSAAMRIISRVMQNTGTSLAKIQAKMSEIIKWLKGQNGSQTEERFNEIWNQ